MCVYVCIFVCVCVCVFVCDCVCVYVCVCGGINMSMQNILYVVFVRGCSNCICKARFITLHNMGWGCMHAVYGNYIIYIVKHEIKKANSIKIHG